MSYVRCLMMAIAAFTSIMILSAQAANAGPGQQWASCECENTGCGTCQAETGTTFYTAKCGVNDARVKSCKKPTCVPVEDQKECFAKLGLAVPGEAAKADVDGQRAPASKSEAELQVAGEVSNVSGQAAVVRATGPVERIREKQTIYVGDRIETKADGMVKVVLKDKSDLIVVANSNVQVDLMKVDEAKKSRQVIVNLLMGKVRSRVNKKFEAENDFKVKTKTAVAGVRGTDFVASFSKSDKEWVSEIRTLEGLVEMERVQRPAKPGFEIPPQKAVEVPAGTYASLVIGPPARDDDEEEFFKSLEASVMSPVMKMKEDEARELDQTTDFIDLAARKKEPVKHEVAANSEEICHSPSGKFKQCSFSCEGNPAGEKKCRTDLPNVSCVRRMCNGNGTWSESRRLPSSASEQCQGGAPQVVDCDSYSYW